ncbi:unnamed protein product [Effrenium voratum]|nr:unnamed protein product [Effrenium voratum]
MARVFAFALLLVLGAADVPTPVAQPEVTAPTEETPATPEAPAAPVEAPVEEPAAPVETPSAPVETVPDVPTAPVETPSAPVETVPDVPDVPPEVPEVPQAPPELSGDELITFYREAHLESLGNAGMVGMKGAWLYGDYINAVPGVEDPVACATACENDEKCYHWNFQVLSKRCDLKAQNGGVNQDISDWITGNAKRSFEAILP